VQFAAASQRLIAACALAAITPRSGSFGEEAAHVVNVHIHQFRPGGAVVDAAALAQFQEQWATYSKLVENDCLSQHQVGAILQKTLNEVFATPFSFLDIACGDASMMKDALRGTKVRHYHGIDLSQAALELAAANLADAPFAIDLDHRDFVDAMMRRPEHADAAWCSLSIHHLSTDDKLKLMKAIHGATGGRGIFLFYEPTRRDGEDRPAWLDRFQRTNKRLWNVLTPTEWDQIWHHVATCDFPETSAVWCELGRAAGFGTTREVFVDPTDFFRLFRFGR
jgi:SAM-dependent methyltransferase